MRGAHWRTNSLRGSGSLEGARTCACTELIIRREVNAAAPRRSNMMAFAG
jgi:hypothetical protein